MKAGAILSKDLALNKARLLLLLAVSNGLKGEELSLIFLGQAYPYDVLFCKYFYISTEHLYLFGSDTVIDNDLV